MATSKPEKKRPFMAIVTGNDSRGGRSAVPQHYTQLLEALGKKREKSAASLGSPNTVRNGDVAPTNPNKGGGKK